MDSTLHNQRKSVSPQGGMVLIELIVPYYLQILLFIWNKLLILAFPEFADET